MNYDLDKAHHFANNNKPALERDHICGCFYCISVFSPKEITEWIIGDNPCDKYGTAICPHCGWGKALDFQLCKIFCRRATSMV